MVNIILDLDETLIHTVKITTTFSKLLANSVDFWFKINNQYFWVLKRPGLAIFIEFVYKHFNVGIWTAAEKDYAKEICRNILSLDQINKSKFIYSRNFCYLDSSLGPAGFTKPLEKIYKIHSDLFNHMNTIMIDNNSHVMRFNHHNGIHVPDFNGDPNDRILYQLRNMIIQYYHNVPMHLPVWGLVDNVNKAFAQNHDIVVNGRRQISPLRQEQIILQTGGAAKNKISLKFNPIVKQNTKPKPKPKKLSLKL
jgi:hypothetical protein